MESADRSRVLLESFLPFIFLIVAAAGYIIPSLLFQDRREEYAVMRALERGDISGEACSLQNISCGSCGCPGRSSYGGGSGSGGFWRHAAGVGNIYGGYMLGAAAAMWKFGRFSIAAVLAHRD